MLPCLLTSLFSPHRTKSCEGMVCKRLTSDLHTDVFVSLLPQPRNDPTFLHYNTELNPDILSCRALLNIVHSISQDSVMHAPVRTCLTGLDRETTQGSCRPLSAIPLVRLATHTSCMTPRQALRREMSGKCSKFI